MADNSKIEWTDHTFNPWQGCTKVSPGCDNCYAETWAKRSGLVEWGAHAIRRRASDSYWRQPLKWDREAERSGIRRKVFCASLSDVFDNRAGGAWRCDLWDLIYATPHLDWLLLTKRPQNIWSMLPRASLGALADWGGGWPNVWLGTTVENQAEADRRIPHLLAVPAAVRFLSCEPLLGALDIGWALARNPIEIAAGFLVRGRFAPGMETLRPLDWVICGGESGPKARPMHPDWARGLRDQCLPRCVPFFFKQWGEWAPSNLFTKHLLVRFSDGATGQLCEIDGENLKCVTRVGKKAAGRVLDGCEWSEMPNG